MGLVPRDVCVRAEAGLCWDPEGFSTVLGQLARCLYLLGLEPTVKTNTLGMC
jgi:hypothetical protein